MDLSGIQNLLELAGGPAFLLRAGRICYASAEAEALGLRVGSELTKLLPDMRLPEPGEVLVEPALELEHKLWTLRAMETEGVVICFLRRQAAPFPGPNESTLLHTAGSIRAALQDLTTALDGLAERVSPQDVEAAGQAALGLRSVYRLRRRAEDLELFARLRAGSLRLNRQMYYLPNVFNSFCGETAELLRSAGCELRWSLAERSLWACFDWPLTAALLRELLANAAANSADGKLFLELSRVGEDKLRFVLTNRRGEPLPEQLFHGHSREETLLRDGMGLGLSIVSLGAAAQGGSLLLSQDREGKVTALLTVALAEKADQVNRSAVQLPTGYNAALSAFSSVLPPELYRVEDLL